MQKSVKIAPNLTYAVTIQGSGKPLFALHGFSENGATWSHLDLPGYQIIAVDLIGHGDSSKPRKQSPYQLQNVLAQLHTLFNQLAPKQPFTLLGYSMGGRLALRYALAYPDAPIEHLILESAGPGLASSEARAQRHISDAKLAENILKNGAAWFADYWGNVPLFASQKKLSELTQKEIWQRRADNAPHALANTLRGTGQGELPYVGDKISSIKSDILYISGQLDEKYSRIAETVFAPCENVRSVSLPGCGHNVHLENPVLYNEIVAEHLSKTK